MKKFQTCVVSVTVIFSLIFLCFFNVTFAQPISLSSGMTYTQNFNELASTGTTGNSLPQGWTFVETGSNADLTYGIGTGSGTAGNTYSFGAAGSTERAFGTLRSGSITTAIIGSGYINNTGETITSLTISYFGEQWRLGKAGRGADRLDFKYSLNANNLSTGNWIDVNELDFNSPVTSGTVGLLDGNVSLNRLSINYTITGLEIPNGATFWIQWADYDVTDADDGLAIDDFSLTPVTTPLPVELVSFSGTAAGSSVNLKWNTATEVNNNGFDIERSNTPLCPLSRGDWKTVGFVGGAGNSNSPKEYSYTDKVGASGKYYYRLKQVDNDGKYEYSDVIEVNVAGSALSLSQNYPNPCNPEATISYSLAENCHVSLKIYDMMGREVASLVNEDKPAGKYDVKFNGSSLASGMYVYKLAAGTNTLTRKLSLLK